MIPYFKRHLLNYTQPKVKRSRMEKQHIAQQTLTKLVESAIGSKLDFRIVKNIDYEYEEPPNLLQKLEQKFARAKTTIGGRPKKNSNPLAA